MASQSPVKFTIGRFGLAQQDRVVVPIRSAVYLGENIGLEVGVVSQQREACTRVVLRVEHAVEGVRPDVLFSNTAEPLDVLEAGAAVRTVVNFSVRSPGVQSVVLTAWLTAANGVVLSCSTNWSFSATYPLGIRTKVRSVRGNFSASGSPFALLEVRVENETDGPLLVAPCLAPSSSDGVTVHTLRPPLLEDGLGLAQSPSESRPALEWEDGSQPGRTIQLQPNNGSYHMVFKATGPDLESGALGRLEVGWVAHQGQRGKLLTQPVSAPSTSNSSVQIEVTSLPAHVRHLDPFRAHVVVTNRGLTAAGPFRVQMPAAGSDGQQGAQEAGRAVVSIGPLAYNMPSLGPGESRVLNVSFVGIQPGVQKLSGVMLYEATQGKWLGTSAQTEVVVEAEEGEGWGEEEGVGGVATSAPHVGVVGDG